jgi:tripartite-type tricarboxylate transporter receptor subunit TctC
VGKGSEMNRTAYCFATVLCLAVSSVARGESAQDFYRNKQIRMIVGYAVGNDYDIGSRLLAKHLPKHIPGRPTIIVQNMPQAASIVAANYIYGQAPRDGTVIGTFSRNLPSQALMGQGNLDVDPRRVNWIGGTSLPFRACTLWHTAPAKTAEDLFKVETIVGSTAAGSALSILPTVFNRVLGTRFKIIEGYKVTQDAVLAAERGEVHGVCSSFGQIRIFEQLIRDGKLRVVASAEETPVAEIPDVPSMYMFARTEEQRHFMRFVFSSVEFGRPYALPPETPKDRIELIRKAFAETVKDPELAAEAEKMKLDMTYRPPADLEALVAKLYQTPPSVIEAVKKLVPMSAQ